MEKVLVIAGGLQIGGAERIAANLAIYSPSNDFVFHYVVFEGYENVFGDEIEAGGGKVFTLPSPQQSYLRYGLALASLIRKYRYSVIHSHTQFNSGINLIVAKAMHVPVRIAHSHTTKTESTVSFFQKTYEKVMRCLIRSCATHFIACGYDAGDWLFGKKTFQKQGIVLRNGIDTEAFSFSPERRIAIRQQYQIASDAFVIGHAGTLLPLKNQEFLIRLMPEILMQRPHSLLLLLGEGDKPEIERLQKTAEECGVVDSIIFAGGVHNVNEILSAMDVFVFPSLREGTPLALIEAQANGLPCVVSDRVPRDAFLTDLIQSLSLENQVGWVNAILRATRINPTAYPARLSDLGYDCKLAYQPIYTIYRSISVLCFSFDDGRGDNTEVINDIFVPLGLPATLNITTGYLDGTCPDMLRPSMKAAMQISDVQRFAKEQSAEIAMHGNNHQNTIDDIMVGREKLQEWLQLDESALLGFASPGSGLSTDDFSSEKFKVFRDSVKYMRTSFRILSKRPLRVFCRKLGRIIHLPTLYRIGYHDTIMTRCDDKNNKIVYSVPVMRSITVGQVFAVVRDAVKHRGALILMFHSVEHDNTKIADNWSWSFEKMRVLCDKIKWMRSRGQLRVCTTAELVEYLQEKSYYHVN